MFGHEKEVKRVRLARMNNAELQLFSEKFTAAFDDEMAVILKIEWHYLQLKLATELIYKSYSVLRKSIITKQVKEQDTKRDNSFSMIKKMVEVHRVKGKEDAETAEAVRVMDMLLKLYKGITRKGYLPSTGMYNALVRDARDEKYAPYFTFLGLNSMIDAIEASNNTFNSMYDSRSEEKASKLQIGRMSDAKANFAEIYYYLLKVVNYYTIIMGNKERTERDLKIEALADKLNVMMIPFEETITIREKKAKTKRLKKENGETEEKEKPAAEEKPKTEEKPKEEPKKTTKTKAKAPATKPAATPPPVETPPPPAETPPAAEKPEENKESSSSSEGIAL